MFSRTVLLHKDARPDKTVKGPGIRPETLKDRVLHHSLLQVRIIHIRDLEFPAAGGFQCPDNGENISIIEIQAGDGIV